MSRENDGSVLYWTDFLGRFGHVDQKTARSSYDRPVLYCPLPVLQAVLISEAIDDGTLSLDVDLSYCKGLFGPEIRDTFLIA